MIVIRTRMLIAAVMFMAGCSGSLTGLTSAHIGQQHKSATEQNTTVLRPEASSIYFPNDSTEFGAEGHVLLEKYARYYDSQKSSGRHLQFVLEGNTDKHGNRGYNLSKGTAMADAVRYYLISLGMNAADISTVSFGEERPMCNGDEEPCLAQNRRVDIVITGLKGK